MSLLNKCNVASGLYTDVISGLSKPQKELPSKYFYDERGSELFDLICTLDEYYPTECEIEIMENNIAEISSRVASNVQLIELGSGSSLKTRLLLENLNNIVSYVPVDISSEYLNTIAAQLQEDYPGIPIHPVAADYTEPFELPQVLKINKKLIYFPGSTIGNFNKKAAKKFQKTLSKNLETGDGLLIGVDLKKDIDVLEAAYNDSKGVTAEFNKNILCRINRELSANFDLDNFEHHAHYNSDEGRIEMHLYSITDQQVKINGRNFSFEKGESIHTENSYKYTVSEFENLASEAFTCIKTWTDSNNYFSVHYFQKS